ncbi:NAD(P)-dependent dehydrogenase, short-chain alcohol dehydrogenase family [Rhizobiales bacterium GAS191]|nr:NAD(P)-dependent dehydrogenase, short-chain alcohol dehydrogenase family [Rhizobiales bacterium GAS191]
MSDPNSQRRVAAVTDGMGGIGQGIVVALTRREFDVVVCDRTIDPLASEEMAAEVAPGARLSFVSGDLTEIGDLPRCVGAIFGAFGHLECLVNNAGVSVKYQGDLLDVSVESYDLNFAINTRGAFFLTQAICRRMLAAERVYPESARSIVFISSSNAAIAAPERGEYAMSKAAVAMMAKLYAIRLAPHGVVVYEVRPGLIRAPMTGVAQARFDKLIEEGFTPINGWGTPEDVGRAGATMAAGELPFTTGAAIQVDGGMHIHQY